MPATTRILGLSAFYHDAAAALVVDGRVVAAAQEERFSKVKHDPSFPERAAAWCLEQAGLDWAALDAVAYHEKPFLKFERIVELQARHAPRDPGGFLRILPEWLGGKLFLKQDLRRRLRRLAGGPPPPLLFGAHHRSHAASAFYPSPFAEAAVLTVDGVGEWATASIAHGRGERLETLRELHFPHSLGLLYSAVTHFLGFRIGHGEYKVMGLAAYGTAAGAAPYARVLRERVARLGADGGLWLDQRHFRYAHGTRTIDDRHWARLFGLPRRAPGAPLEQRHADLAWAFQRFTEDALLAMAREAHRLTGSPRCCLAGGVALNGVALGRLREEGPFGELWVPPAAGDAGCAAGAALDAAHGYFGRPREPARDASAGMAGGFLGPAFGREAIDAALARAGLRGRTFADRGALEAALAERLAGGALVGWFRGRMEFGPRALGARSILADARDAAAAATLNRRVKGREAFRPFAPVMLREEAERYFGARFPAPFMQEVRPLAEAHRDPWPEPPGPAGDPADPDGLVARFARTRGPLPAVTHVDGTARLQVVEDPGHPLHGLLHAFRARTGLGLLVNTSFNRRDEPIVRTPDDAVATFLHAGLDVLILEDRWVERPSAEGPANGPWTSSPT